MNKYQAACNNEGIHFYPLVVETFGGWHSESEAVIVKLAAQLARQTDGDLEETKRHLFQRLSIFLTRGNAALLTSRNPQNVDAIIDGDLDF